MYRYAQKQEKGTWRAFTSPAGFNQKEIEKAIKDGAKKVTILSVSEVVDEFTNKDQLAYQGPLYFDIDCKDDLYLAIKSAKELVKKLLDAEVHKECIAVYCSGSKGMHVIVDERAFSSGRPVRLLPKIYKEMAKHLYVFGLDYQVYSGGRGNSFRLPNVERSDGKYRVPVTHEELSELTPEVYQDYVKAPRNFIDFPEKVDKGHAPALATIFERAKHEVHKKVKKQEKQAPLSDEVVAELSAQIPQCVHDLCDGKANKSANFNEIAFQLAIYLSSVKADSQVTNGLAGRLAAVTESSTYNTERKRLEHLVGLAGYTSSSGSNHRFACGAMRNILSTKPCEGCPVDGKKSPTEQAAEGVDLGILEKDDGYYIIGVDGERRVSTFTLEILDYHSEVSPDSSVERRTGFKARVKAKGINCVDSAEIFMSESMWQSKSSLISEIQGITNIVFLGTDTDVQKVKNYVFSQSSAEVGKITAVYTAGILPQKIGASEIMVYVEPEGSMNQLRVRDTHHINADITSPPQLLNAPMPQPNDEQVAKTLRSLMSINTPVNMGTLIGWHVACHFKTHLVKEFNQFPILSVWGPAGVGKTMTATQVCFLNGCDYTGEHSPIDTAGASEWALIDYCSSTTTAPRILDEANESKMKRKYFQFAEVLKSAWGNLTINRGTVSKAGGSTRGRTGARTVRIPISAPLITISEQSLTMPALQQRSVQVFLTTDARGEHERAAFEYVTDHREDLIKIGKALMIQALTTQSKDLKKLILEQRDLVPKAYDDRPRYSFAVVLAGLKMLRHLCHDMGYLVLDKIDEMYNATLKHITDSVDDILREKSRTEIDLILTDMALMASVTQAGMSKELVENTHYTIHNGNLLLDYRTAFPLYLQYCSRTRKDAVVTNINQFHALIRQEPYFMDEGIVPGFATRPVMVLNGQGLKEKGIDLTLFSQSYILEENYAAGDNAAT